MADGTSDAEKRIRKVLNADPGLGVIRHADAGYESSINVIKGKPGFRSPYF